MNYFGRYTLVLVGALGFASPVGAQVPGLFAARGLPYVAPDGSFELMLPSGWSGETIAGKARTVEFRRIGAPGHGRLVVRHLKVPEGAIPRQLMLRAIETRLRALPGSRIGSRRDVTVASLPAASVVGHFDFQGNAQFPKVFEELFVVAGTDAYVLHFDCAEPVADVYAADLNAIYASFRPRTMVEPTDSQDSSVEASDPPAEQPKK